MSANSHKMGMCEILLRRFSQSLGTMDDWGNLKYFIEFGLRGSLLAVAQRLGVDHSTVARRIEALEQDLGVRLVVRLPRAYHLTPAGERVLELARQVETSVGEIERFVRGADPLPAGSVRLSGPPMLSSHFLAPRLVPLRKRHPELQVELIGDLRAVSLGRREADLALRLSHPREKELVARRVAMVGYGLYGSRHYLDATASEAWDYLGYDESLDHVPQQRWLKSLAGDRPLALRSNDLATLIMAARAGLGVAAIPHILAYEDPLLKQARVTTPGPTRELWLLFYRDLGRSPRVRAVIDHLVSVTAEAQTAFRGSSPAAS
jgi:DNA-binding transcriptional LysR family regulator